MSLPKAWELRLERWHRAYADAGRAYIFRCHPGVKHVSGGRVVYAEKGAPDFVGAAGGLPVALDAKFQSSHKLYTSKIPEHQRKGLFEIWEQGGVAFLAIRFALGTDFTDCVYPMRPGTLPVAITPEMCLSMDPSGWFNLIELIKGYEGHAATEAPKRRSRAR